MRNDTSTRQRFIIRLAGLVITILSTTVCSSAQTWIPKGSIPANAVVGGRENDRDLYVCRASYEGGLHPGKIISGNCNRLGRERS